MWKVNYSTWHDLGTKENLSPRHELKPGPAAEHVAGALSTELSHGEEGDLTESIFGIP